MIQPVDYFLAFWFALAIASAIYVGVDHYQSKPEPAVMKWGFILVTLYVLADKEPRPGEHEKFIQPLTIRRADAQSCTSDSASTL